MKIVFRTTTASRKNEVRRIGLAVSSYLLFATISFASQSSIGQKVSFNSDRQITFLTSGTWGIDEKSFVAASFAHSRTPTFDGLDTDTFYQGTLSIGYSVSNLAFDIGFNIAQSPLQRERTLGGSIGLTWIFVPSILDPDDYRELALRTLHSQIYERKEEKAPLFWVRLGYLGNSMKTNIIEYPANSGKESAFSFDLYYPWSNELISSFSAGFHGYDNSRGFFDRSLQNTTDVETLLLTSTIQGLPHTTLALQSTWQLAPRDAIIPRYQATEIDSSRKWTHTIDLGWRHQFSPHWYLTPTYEVTMQLDQASTGVMTELYYAF
ncbi:MAG: hypothetical protein HY075_15500 [Deltaproteobacteria bacterium]|nr:hypothetical protein [Deltaproteobacteria bacterium]